MRRPGDAGTSTRASRRTARQYLPARSGVGSLDESNSGAAVGLPDPSSRSGREPPESLVFLDIVAAGDVASKAIRSPLKAHENSVFVSLWHGLCYCVDTVAGG